MVHLDISSTVDSIGALRVAEVERLLTCQLVLFF